MNIYMQFYKDISLKFLFEFSFFIKCSFYFNYFMFRSNYFKTHYHDDIE